LKVLENTFSKIIQPVLCAVKSPPRANHRYLYFHGNGTEFIKHFLTIFLLWGYRSRSILPPAALGTAFSPIKQYPNNLILFLPKYKDLF